MTHQFFVTLPSDSSMKYYAENTVAKFTTKLPQSISLDGEYEVGLAEIIYPQTWYNINNSKRDYWVAFGDSPSISRVPIKRCYIETGNYNNEDEFIDSLNTQMKTAFKDIEIQSPEFMYNKHTQKIQYKLNKFIPPPTMKHLNSQEFYISPELRLRLGITTRFTGKQKNAFYLADEKFILNEDLHLMFVYCDVASHTVVGDTTAPLLRVINLNMESGVMKRLSFPDIHYIPVQKRHFETIEISINTARGSIMPFETGRSVVTLHFRRVFNIFQK